MRITFHFCTGLVLAILGANPLRGDEPKNAPFAPLGRLSEKELAALTYGETDKNGIALGLHLPDKMFRTGESVPAFLTLRNEKKEGRALGMVLSPPGTLTPLRRSASMVLLSLPTRKSISIDTGRERSLVALSHVGLPGNGFITARVELNPRGELAPGEYLIQWRFDGAESNQVRFSVLPVRKVPTDVDQAFRTRMWRFREPWTGAADVLEVKKPHELTACHAALNLAMGGVQIDNKPWYVPDLRRVPAEDDMIQVRADWHFGEKTDRVVLHFSVRDTKKTVLCPELHFCLLADFPPGPGGPPRDGEADRAERGRDPRETPKLPEKVELHFPNDWRSGFKGKDGDAGPRVALVITARRISTSVGVRESSSSLVRGVQWQGILKTSYQDFPGLTK